MNRFFAILALCGLSACGAMPTLPTMGTAPQTLSLNGGLTVTGPSGYCVDKAASRPRANFALLAACARVSDADRLPFVDAIVTVQSAGAQSGLAGQEEAINARLDAPGGLFGAGVTAGETEREGRTVFVSYTAEAPYLAGTQSAGLKAVTTIEDQLLVLTAHGLDGSALSRSDLTDVLRGTILAMRAAN